ncbi:hypothetical protein H6F88_17550 [Oculatella sp. FACHB-28]|nr:hypothetical protein [Oculatella sp. FACHB-28]MBD2057803.1 hypothetical protein [Oculatella sp. FACHB-28]
MRQFSATASPLLERVATGLSQLRRLRSHISAYSSDLNFLGVEGLRDRTY